MSIGIKAFSIFTKHTFAFEAKVLHRNRLANGDSPHSYIRNSTAIERTIDVFGAIAMVNA